MSPDTQDPAFIQDVAAYFGATASAPEVASPNARRADDDEAVQADVNTYFGVEAGR